MSYTETTHQAFHGHTIDPTDPKVLAWLVRRHALEMTHLSRGSHIGSVLSVAEIVAVLYAQVLKINPSDPQWPARDRLIMSKGHGGAAIYACLAERGFFPVEELKTHDADGSRLSGHISHKTVPGVDFSTGSLGHGLAVACGMALGAKRLHKAWRTYCILGDGECDEGSVWEAALEAQQHQLDNLCVIVDRNRMQSLDFTENTLRKEPFAAKWRDFGFHVIEVDGHSIQALQHAFAEAACTQGKPSIIIASTIKGKGVSFMENNILWHYRTPQGEEYEAALKEINALCPFQASAK